MDTEIETEDPSTIVGLDKKETDITSTLNPLSGPKHLPRRRKSPPTGGKKSGHPLPAKGQRQLQLALTKPKHGPPKLKREGSDSSSPLPIPRSPIDDAFGDPFASIGVDLPQWVVTENFQRCASIVRELASTNSSDSHGAQFSQSLLSMAVHHRTTLYCMFASGMSFTRIGAENQESSPSALELHVASQAVSCLREQMSHPALAVREENIWAVTALAYRGEALPLRSGKLPRQSFLKELQELNIFGRIIADEAHKAGLISLVQLHGGIGNLKTPGMASSITYAHLFEMTRALEKVFLPYIPFTSSYLDEDQDRLAITQKERAWALPDLQTLGFSFFRLWSDTLDENTTALLRVTQHLCDFTVLVENYIEGRANPRAPAAFTDQRNYTHHSLMALMSAQELEAQGRNDYDLQYESCRLGCLVYSLLVVFPFPPVVRLFERLSARLRRTLLNMRLPTIVQQDRWDLHVWVLSMGGIISTGLPIRDWFISELAFFCRALGVSSHEDLLHILQGFLWHPATNGEDGEQLWEDINLATSKIKSP